MHADFGSDGLNVQGIHMCQLKSLDTKRLLALTGQ